MSSVAHSKVTVAQQLAEYLEMEDMVSSNSKYESLINPPGELPDIERLISRYLIAIATEPLVNSKNIVEVFDLYARTGRPLVQDMHNFPEEFMRLIPVSEQGLAAMTYSDLHHLARSLSFLRNQDLKMVHRLIKAVCHECSTRVKHVSFQEGIKYFEIVHHFNATRQPFYAIFSEYFSQHMDEASEKDLVKLMHYCTQKRKTSDADLVQKALNRLEDSLDSISFVTLGIVAGSVAKSGLKLSSDLPLLQRIVPVLVARIAEDTEWTGLEMYAFHSMINLFRLARFIDDDVTSAVEHFLLTCEDSCLDAQVIPEFIAFLAGRSYHREVFARVEHLVLLLLKSNVSATPRLQDFARILWAFSSTDHKCSEEFVSLVFANLHSFSSLEYTNNNFLKFVDGLQSLAMMGHIDRHITPLAFEPLKGRARGYKGPLFTKLEKRLVVLRQCLTIVAPELSLPLIETSSAPSDLSLELQQRPVLSTLFDQLKHLNECSKDGAVVFLACPISTVNVASVCINTKAATAALTSPKNKCSDTIDEQLLHVCSKLGSNVSIEVLDRTCTMKDVQQGSRSTGLVSFKTRLLKKVGWKHIFVSGGEVENGIFSKKTLLDSLNYLL